jgi:hypothetical protein
MAERTESPTGDPLIAEHEQAEAEAERTEEDERAQRAANLFDLRRIIGGLFLVYGVILVVLGITDSQKEIDKAAGVNVNLYTGLAMIAVAILFLIWAFARPMSKQLEEAEREAAMLEREDAGDGNGRGGRFEPTNGGATNGAPGDDRVGARAAH